MDTTKLRIEVIGLVLILLTLAGCGPTSTMPANSNGTFTDSWQTYINPKYNFSLEYPPGWQVKEFLSTDYSMGHDEVWFAAGEFPPDNTDAQPDVLLIITEENPSAQWMPDFFDDYQSETIQLGDGRATKISGVNKESLHDETVVIMKLNEVYLQAFPGKSKEATGFFDRILASLEPSPEAISIAAFPGKGVTCIFPYFDPIAFLPDHDRILIRADSRITVFNLKTLKEEIVLEPPMQVVKAALSPNGQIVAWALEDHTIELIELSSETILKKLEGHTGIVTSIKFSSTGNRLYTASHDNYVKVWTAEGDLVSEILPGGGEVLGISVSPDDTKLVIVTLEGLQKLWNLRTNDLIGELGSSGAFDGADVSFSPDGKIFGISSANGPVSLWDTETKTQLWSGGDYAVTLSPDGRLFVYSDTDNYRNALIVVRSLDGLEPIRVLKGQGSLIWKIIISADGSRMASADGNEIRIWQINNGELLYSLSSACP